MEKKINLQLARCCRTCMFRINTSWLPLPDYGYKCCVLCGFPPPMPKYTIYIGCSLLFVPANRLPTKDEFVNFWASTSHNIQELEDSYDLIVDVINWVKENSRKLISCSEITVCSNWRPAKRFETVSKKQGEL